MRFSEGFRFELGEVLKDRNFREFERNWISIIRRLEQAAAPTVKTYRDPYKCPKCHHPLEGYSEEFMFDLGEVLKRGDFLNFEHKWVAIIGRLEQDAARTVKTGWDPWRCPTCGYIIR